jgi:glycosyltransferase involved in cell wall biosynthesis
METVPTLGVVAISYNEERDLPGFLDNVLPWVNEIIIVDDGSTDGTLALLQTAGPKVKCSVAPRRAGEYFAQQRNKGISLAESEWLLHMDIDERVPPELAEEILRAIKDDSKDGYRFRRLNYFLHRPMRGGGWQDWNMIHLARRTLFHFEGMFHEACVIDAPEGRIGQLQNPMWHLNDVSYKVRMEKSLRYSEEQSERIARRYNKITWLHLCGLPLLEFVRKYLVKRGFRDGMPGLIFAGHAADAMFRACALVWDAQNRIERVCLEERLGEKWRSGGAIRLQQEIRRANE